MDNINISIGGVNTGTSYEKYYVTAIDTSIHKPTSESVSKILGYINKQGKIQGNCINCWYDSIEELSHVIEKYVKNKTEKHPTIKVGCETIYFANDGISIGCGGYKVDFSKIEQIYQHMKKLQNEQNK